MSRFGLERMSEIPSENNELDEEEQRLLDEIKFELEYEKIAEKEKMLRDFNHTAGSIDGNNLKKNEVKENPLSAPSYSIPPSFPQQSQNNAPVAPTPVKPTGPLSPPPGFNLNNQNDKTNDGPNTSLAIENIKNRIQNFKNYIETNMYYTPSELLEDTIGRYNKLCEQFVDAMQYNDFKVLSKIESGFLYLSEEIQTYKTSYEEGSKSNGPGGLSQ